MNKSNLTKPAKLTLEQVLVIPSVPYKRERYNKDRTIYCYACKKSFIGDPYFPVCWKCKVDPTDAVVELAKQLNYRLERDLDESCGIHIDDE